MRPRVACKLALLICAASVVAYVATFAGRHPRVACTGPDCDVPVQIFRADAVDFSGGDAHPTGIIGYGGHLNESNKEMSLETVMIHLEQTEGETEREVSNGENYLGDGKEQSSRDIEFALVTSSSSNGEQIPQPGRSPDTDVIENKGKDIDQTTKVEVQGGKVMGRDSNVQSYLERVGIIKQDKGENNFGSRNDMDSWKSKAAAKIAAIGDAVKKDQNNNDPKVLFEAETQDGAENGADVQGARLRNKTTGNGDVVANYADDSVVDDGTGNVIVNSAKAQGTQSVIRAATATTASNKVVLSAPDGHTKNSKSNNGDRSAQAGESRGPQSDQNEHKATVTESQVHSINDGSEPSGKADAIVKDDQGEKITSKDSVAKPQEDSVGSLLQRAGVIAGGPRETAPKAPALGKPEPISAGHPQDEADAPETSTDSRKVCVEFLTGTGNILFQFASAYAIAKERNMTLAIPESIPRFSEAFDLSAGDDDVISFDQSGCDTAARASNYKRGVFDQTFLKRVSSDTDVKMHGYFQSYKYFQHLEDEIRDALVFKEDILNKAMETINILHYKKFGKSLHFSRTSEGLTIVGVHIRRGDPDKRSSRENEGYRVAPLEYLQHAMTEMRHRYGNSGNNTKEGNSVRFYVVTDDEGWAETNLNIRELQDTMLVTRLSWAPRLALLSHMDHVITTVGALGWWGAWLAGGDVIYYQDFLESGSNMDTAYLAADYFPPTWEPMV